MARNLHDRTVPINGQSIYAYLDEMWWQWVAIIDCPRPTRRDSIDRLEISPELRDMMFKDERSFHEIDMLTEREPVWRGQFPIVMVKHMDPVPAPIRYDPNTINIHIERPDHYVALRFMKPNGRIAYVDAPFNHKNHT